MKINYLLFLFMMSYSFNNNFENNDIELPALRTSKNFSKGYRVLKTTISDPSVFDAKFPATNLSVGYVLRYYFYTGIDLSSSNNELISMNGTYFEIPVTSDPIELARIAIYEIRDMSFGYREYKEFEKTSQGKQVLAIIKKL
tara:strand:- start:50 stop:475 length:426 start_codon:yes stop_codon:yes gene_type:complete